MINRNSQPNWWLQISQTAVSPPSAFGFVSLKASRSRSGEWFLNSR